MAAKGTTPKSKPADEKADGTTSSVKSDAVAAAHDAIAEANARKADQDKRSAAEAQTQQKNAAANVAADETAKAAADDVPGRAIGLPEVDPKTPLSMEEQAALANAREVISRADDPNAPVLTKDAQKRIDDAEYLPPASQRAPQATPGASATNPALARNDVDVAKTPPFGFNSRPDLRTQG